MIKSHTADTCCCADLLLLVGGAQVVKQAPSPEQHSVKTATPATTPTVTVNPAAHHAPWATLPKRRVSSSVLHVPKEASRRNQEPRAARSVPLASTRHSLDRAAANPARPARSPTRPARRSVSSALPVHIPPEMRQTPALLAWIVLLGRSATCRARLSAFSARPVSIHPRRNLRSAWIARWERTRPVMAAVGACLARQGSQLAVLAPIPQVVVA